MVEATRVKGMHCRSAGTVTGQPLPERRLTIVASGVSSFEYTIKILSVLPHLYPYIRAQPFYPPWLEFSFQGS